MNLVHTAWRTRRLYRTSLLLAGLTLLASLLPGLPAALEFDRAQIAVGQAWRLLTGHLTHASFSTLLLDLVVFMGLGMWCERLSRGRFLLTVGASMAAVSASILLTRPDIQIYRGLSAVDSALFALLCMTVFRQSRAEGRRAISLLSGLAGLAFLVKIVYEVMTESAVFASIGPDFVPLAFAHLVGAAVGLAVAALPRPAAREQPTPREPCPFASSTL